MAQEIVGTGMPATAAARLSRGQVGLLIAVLSVIYTVALVDRFLLALLVDPIKADLGLTDIQVSLVIGVAFSVFYGAFSIPAGFLADRVGRRGLIGTAAIGWSLMTAFCGFAIGFWHLFVGRAGVGLAEAFITPTSLSLIRDRVPERLRGRAFSFFAMGPNVGGALALFGGGALLAAAGDGVFSGLPFIGGLHPWQIVLVVIGLAGCIPVLPLVLLRRDNPAERPHLADGMTWGASGLWQHLRANAATYSLLIGYATLSAMLAFGINGWMPAMMSRKFDIPLPQIGAISGPISLVGAIGGLALCGIVLDRIAARGGEVLVYGMIAGVGAIVAGSLMPLVASQTAAWTLYGVAIFFMGSFYSVAVTKLAQITPSAMMGKVVALYLIFQSSIGGALAPTTTALIAANFSGPLAIAFGLSIHCAVMGTLGLALCVTLALHLRKSDRHTARA